MVERYIMPRICPPTRPFSSSKLCHWYTTQRRGVPLDEHTYHGMFCFRTAYTPSDRQLRERGDIPTDEPGRVGTVYFQGGKRWRDRTADFPTKQTTPVTSPHPPPPEA